jgi:hypothetical protein
MAITCDGTLAQAADGAPLCDGQWIVEPSQLNQLYELLNSAFSTPDAVSVGAAFMAAFALPMIAYLASWGYQTVINFLSDDEVN